MPNVISSVPTSFDLPPFGGRWFRWSEVSNCFWPGRGGRALLANPELAPVRFCGGVYCLAWSEMPPRVVGPTVAAVKYIGESGEFQRRMGQFGNSAGFFGDRQDGHSAAWRWPLGHKENAWVSFFLVGESLPPHLAEGLRHWMEAVALEEFRLLYGKLPAVNEAGSELVRSTADVAVVDIRRSTTSSLSPFAAADSSSSPLLLFAMGTGSEVLPVFFYRVRHSRLRTMEAAREPALGSVT